MRINFTKIEILKVKMGVKVSKNITHFHIALAMPPMQMDINYPLNIGKISDGKITQGKILPRVNFPLRKYKNPQIFYRMNLHQLKSTQ